MYMTYNYNQFNAMYDISVDKTVHALYDVPLTTWSLEDVRMARFEQSNGQFMHACDLSRSMMTDSAFVGCLAKRIASFTRAKRVVKPLDENDKLQVQAANMFTALLPQMFPKSELQMLVRYYLMIGMGLGTNDWYMHFDQSGKYAAWLPSLRYLNPRNAYYNILGQHNVLITFDGIRTISPGDSRWVQVSDWHHGDATGFVATLGEDWYQRNIALRDLADFREAHCWPIIEVKTPAGLNPVEQQKLEADILEARRSKVIFTKMSDQSDEKADASLEIHDGTGGVNPEIYLSSVTMYNDRFASTILGSNIAQDVGGVGGTHGSFAAKDSAEDGLTKLLLSDFETFDKHLTEQVIVPAYKANFGTSIPAGKLCTVPEETDMSGEKAALFAQFAQGIAALGGAGLVIKNINEFVKDLGLNIEIGAGSKLLGPSTTATMARVPKAKQKR